MADNFNLPPDANDFNLSVALHKQAMPYVTAWYQDLKKDGETPEQFLRRLIYTHALRYRIQKIARQISEERMAAEEANRDDTEAVESDFATALSTFEAL